MLQYGCFAALAEEDFRVSLSLTVVVKGKMLAVAIRPACAKSLGVAVYLPVHEPRSGSMLALLGSSLRLMLLWTICPMSTRGVLVHICRYAQEPVR